MTRVAIVGGGASGTLVAANLLARSASSDEVVIIEPRESLGQGVAYSTSHPQHLLNVRAKQMSAVVGDPEHFVRFAGCHRDDFVARSTYARYLQDLLATRVEDSSSRFTHLVDCVESIDRVGGSWSITTEDGRCIETDVVVIATGNPAPSIPTWASGAAGSPRFIADPWAPHALEDLGGTIVAVGTGLTFVDVAVSVLGSSPTTRIVGVSRHGLMPAPHTHVEHPPPLPDLRTPRDVLHWLRSQRTHWREAVNGLRSVTQQLWINWSDDDRRRFLRHAHRYWEIHRHRIAEPVAQAIEGYRADGRLSVRALRVEDLIETQEGFELRARGEVLHADHVIACTGPSERAMVEAPPVAGLIAAGHLRPGPLGIGLDCDPITGAVIDARGNPRRGLFVMGPLRRGVAWETTAIPEICVQADVVARAFLSD